VEESEKLTFLRNIIPFSTLSDAALEEITGTMSWRTFPPDQLIIAQGVKGTHFYLIRSGLTKVFLSDEEQKETVLAFLGEGDCFGEIALLTEGPTTAQIQSTENTVCLVQEKAEFLSMMQKHPLFYKYFNQLLTQRMRTVYKELLTENPGVAQVEPFLYRKQVREIVPPSQPWCGPETTIGEAARIMLEKDLNALVVLNEEGGPAGVVHLKGLLKAAFMDPLDTQEPVRAVMETTFHAVGGESYFFEALYQMTKNQANELIVMDGDKVEGIITGFDLLRFRGREVLSLLRNIEDAQGFSQLNALRGEVEKVLRALITDGALASQACKIVSELNDKVARRVITLVEEECGKPPIAYAWLGMGSEGRKEQTLLTDQDNAIIFGSPASTEAHEYFGRFSSKVVEGLSLCGIPLCKGGIMATNPTYSGELDEWKTRVATLVGTPDLTEKELMDTYVFLDFRSVHGDRVLERRLRFHLLSVVKDHPLFLKTLAQGIVSIPIPVGFFKNFIVEKSGKYKDKLNLKLYGLVPLITCLKLLSIHEGIAETNTLARMRALAENQTISRDMEETLEQAFETFLTLKIRNNLSDLDRGEDLSNYINPAELSTRQKQLLKEAFWAVSQLQKTTKTILKAGEQEFGVMR
jgi:CBS domain-containing protein